MDTLQFCEKDSTQDPDAPYFVPLIPVSNGADSISWTVTETGYASQATFNYRVFVTDVYFATEGIATLSASLNGVQGTYSISDIRHPTLIRFVSG